jgi:hypothetical protein
LNFSEIEAVCDAYGVSMKSSEDISIFFQLVNEYRRQQGKAAHLLFNQIETDVQEKYQFLTKQNDGLTKMIKIYRNLIGKINVL